MNAGRSIPIFLAALMTTSLGSACNRGPDPKDQIERDLKSASISNVNVDYDRSNQVIHLKGAVDASAEKSRAEEIAQRAVGTSGRVANELTVKGVDDKTADDMDNAIRKELNAKVNNDRTLEDRSINFDVNNGVVTIKGEVRNQAEKAKVNEMAKSTENVRDIVNALEINPNIGGNKPAVPNTSKAAPPARERTAPTEHKKRG
jgi:hyperosmotically inducible periplasmic protein